MFTFHSESEDDVLLPEVQRLLAPNGAAKANGHGAAPNTQGPSSSNGGHATAAGGTSGYAAASARAGACSPPPDVLAACQQCSGEHASEIALLEDLGRLLADARQYARRCAWCGCAT